MNSQASAVVFVDTMIVIEAVRTCCWNAITGQHQIVTVEECANELSRGDASTAGYVPVTQHDIDRMKVDPLTPEASVRFRLEYADADRLDAGERDLLALAYGWDGEASPWTMVPARAATSASLVGNLAIVFSSVLVACV